jgi:hypothetical protein
LTPNINNGLIRVFGQRNKWGPHNAYYETQNLVTHLLGIKVAKLYLFWYDSTMKDPRLILIEESIGVDEALLLIRGYLSERKREPEDNAHWQRSLREAGWRGPIYYLWWDASSSAAFFLNALLIITRLPMPPFHKVLQVLSRAGISVTALLIHWRKVKRRAKRVGRNYLPELLNLIPESKVTIMGFSLGALIAYYGLINMGNRESHVINNVILLGGAVARDKSKDWNKVIEPLEGKIINVFNGRDYMLRYLFRMAQVNPKSPCGLKPIKLNHPKIINIDATEEMSGSPGNHWEHVRALRNTIGWLFE